MDIKRLYATLQMAELRAESDPSEANLAILEQAREDYEYAADPEKKTEDEETDEQDPDNQDLDEENSQEDPDSQSGETSQKTVPITNNPLKTKKVVAA